MRHPQNSRNNPSHQRVNKRSKKLIKEVEEKHQLKKKSSDEVKH